MTAKMTAEEEAEVLAILEAVGTTMTAHPGDGYGHESFAKHYCGNYEFKLSNGWTVVVFNDCNSWDYIDCIEAPDGRSWDYPTGEHRAVQMTSNVAHWNPTTDAQWAAWGVSP